MCQIICRTVSLLQLSLILDSDLKFTIEIAADNVRNEKTFSHTYFKRGLQPKCEVCNAQTDFRL